MLLSPGTASFQVLLCLFFLIPSLLGGQVSANRSEPLRRELLEELEGAEIGSEAQLGVYLLDVPTGMPFLDMDGSAPMTPASLMKLVTTAAAIDLLGPQQTFITKAITYGAIEGNMLKGDLIVVGGGDPTFGPRFQTDDPNNVAKQLEDWAEQLRDRGIRQIRGNIVGDATRYANDPHGLAWSPAEFAEWYSAEVSPLTYNDNCIDVIWQAGGRRGRLADYRLNPQTTYVNLASSVRITSPRREDADIRYFRFQESNDIRARGIIPAETDKYDYAAIHDPARFTAHLFMEALRRKGVTVAGGAFNRRDLALYGDDDPTSAPLHLLSQTSPPLAEILPVINGNSQNLYAEMLHREVALAMGEEASFIGGARAINDWLRRHQLHRNGFTMVDGSGLSPLNRTPARLLAEVMRFMDQGRNAATFRRSLAAPGSRSMRNRFLEPRYDDLRQNLRAKTGYIEGVHSLAGFMTNHRGTEYIFVIMLNGFDQDRTREARDLLDRLALLVYSSEVLP